MSGPTHLAHNVLVHAVASEGGKWTTARAAELLAAAGCPVDRNTAWGLLRHITRTGPPAGQLSLFTRGDLRHPDHCTKEQQT